jgi:hypothetical protein
VPWLLLLADVADFQVPEVDPLVDGTVLAAEVATRCGDPYSLVQLTFTLVLEVDGEEKARRTHVWRPRDGTVTVSWEGEQVALESIHPYVASPDPIDQAIDAYSWFINDSYWLLAPCKVLDPGVTQAVTTAGQLALSFSPETGITPADRYWLSVNEGVVQSWDYLLQDGGHATFLWDPPQRYGPLELSPRRVSADGTVIIRFEEIRAQ